MTDIFVDSDIILDLLLKREAHHLSAVRLFSAIENGEIIAYTSPVVITNIYYISARIIGITEDGNFLIRGSKEVETNGEKVTTVVSGIIRGEDISPNNTISSNLIADASIYHEGKGVVKQGNRPGIFTRLINWIF